MSENNKPKVANWEPGTLDATRRAIGEIDEGEAKRMAKVIGGEVMYEKQVVKDEEPQRRRGALDRVAAMKAAKEREEKLAALKKAETEGVTPLRKTQELPPLPSKVTKPMDKIMMSGDYAIKKDYGALNFIRYFKKNGLDEVITSFCTVDLRMQLDNLAQFANNVAKIIAHSPPQYTPRIEEGTDTKFLLLRMVREWKVDSVKSELDNVLVDPPPYTVTGLVTFTRAAYRLVLPIYYYGTTKIGPLLKEVYADMCEYPETKKPIVLSAVREAIRLWMIIDNDLIKRMYPLLMRMCSKDCYDYPQFFMEQKAAILKYLDLQKFDLLIEGVPTTPTTTQESTEPKKESEIDPLAKKGLALLDKLFPEAGFDKLDTHPDFFGYFQPLYHFRDGFNALSSENPLQALVVIARIIEDFFHGLRNVEFLTTREAGTSSDTFSAVMDDWSNYRENVFEKLYCSTLNDLANQCYTQPGFGDGQLGKKLKTTLYWQTQYHFLPFFKVERLTLEKPIDDSNLPPLYTRTRLARHYLLEVVKQCDKAQRTKGEVAFMKQAWDHYAFAIQNEVSRRLDVLLNAKDHTSATRATNASLVKYTLYIVATLDWYINNTASPAYKCNSQEIFRVNKDDGKPEFSIPMRNDQNKLFAARVKASLLAKKEK